MIRIVEFVFAALKRMGRRASSSAAPRVRPPVPPGE
jgi:hypothetical protein